MKRTLHKPPRGATKFPGIVSHADKLDCSRVHLHLVLTGKRRSSRLLKAYEALLKDEGITVPKNLGQSAA